jgi:hypothetical protein
MIDCTIKAGRGSIVGNELIAADGRVFHGVNRAAELSQQIKAYQPTCEAEFAAKLAFLCR